MAYFNRSRSVTIQLWAAIAPEKILSLVWGPGRRKPCIPLRVGHAQGPSISEFDCGFGDFNFSIRILHPAIRILDGLIPRLHLTSFKC